MFDLGTDRPDAVPPSVPIEANNALRREGLFLSEDFCVLDGRNFLVRCVLEIPVHGMNEKFGFGCWGSLKSENFDMYIKNFDSGSFNNFGPWWSWLCNGLYPFTDTEPVACEMFLQPQRQRPVLRVKQEDHPLFEAQQDGISPALLLQIYAHYGHPVAL